MKKFITAISIFATIVIITPVWISVNEAVQYNAETNAITEIGELTQLAFNLPYDAGRTRT